MELCNFWVYERNPIAPPFKYWNKTIQIKPQSNQIKQYTSYNCTHDLFFNILQNEIYSFCQILQLFGPLLGEKALTQKTELFLA